MDLGSSDDEDRSQLGGAAAAFTQGFAREGIQGPLQGCPPEFYEVRQQQAWLDTEHTRAVTKASHNQLNDAKPFSLPASYTKTSGGIILLFFRTCEVECKPSALIAGAWVY
jgi:hypothetical protein